MMRPSLVAAQRCLRSENGRNLGGAYRACRDAGLSRDTPRPPTASVRLRELGPSRFLVLGVNRAIKIFLCAA
jgi:hypothetical protein